MHQGGEEPVPVPPIIYGREFFTTGEVAEDVRDRFLNRASQLAARGVAPNVSVLVVGSAYGYLIERLLEAGIPNVWGIEPGDWWWNPLNAAEWSTQALLRTAKDWIGSGNEQASLNALGVPGQARFNFVIDEDVATCHSDAELPAFIAGLEARLQGNNKSRIVHLVSASRTTGVGGDSALNWKTLDDWKAVAPSHTWLDLRGT